MRKKRKPDFGAHKHDKIIPDSKCRPQYDEHGESSLKIDGGLETKDLIHFVPSVAFTAPQSPQLQG
jgi:hypothetical protein